MIEALNITVSWALLMLIWLVQVIIYPSFRNIPEVIFPKYHRWYGIRISFFVFPLMICEILLLILLAIDTNRTFVVYSSFSMVGAVWLSTLLLQVPIHLKIDVEKNDDLIERLVKTNWIRTAAWSIKALFMTTIIF
jgi:hypothetical protein